jgi:actin-related protein 5
LAQPRCAQATAVTRARHTAETAVAATNRSAARSPFDGSIPNNATLTERLFDGVLARLGLAEQDAIQHPLVLTEPPCQPNGVRAQFTELVFEAYEFPKLCIGIDALFSYLYNNHTAAERERRELSAAGAPSGVRFAPRKAGIVVSCGYQATHILPVFNGRFHAPAAKRINVGGHHMTSDLMRRLQLNYPDQSAVFTYSRVESLTHDLCYVAKDYGAELASMRDDVGYFDSVSKIVKFPSTGSGPERPGLSAEELERARLLRIERGKRLSDMMKERNRSKAVINGNGNGTGKKGSESDLALAVSEDEALPLQKALSSLRELERLSDTRNVDEDIYYLARVKAGFETEESFKAEVSARESVLRLAQDALGDVKAELVETAWRRKVQEDELIAVSDSELSATGLKRKRHLRSLRGAAETRLRIKREKAEAQEKLRLEEEQNARLREEDPENYLASLKAEREELARKIRRRAAAKDAGSDRRSLAARERMRLLAQHAGNKGGDDGTGAGNGSGGPGGRKRDKAKDSDTFGMNDSDWDVYRDMRVRDDGGGESEDDSTIDQKRLDSVRAQITDIVPDEEDPTMVRAVGSALLYVPHPFHDEIPIVVDRIRIPEILFQPSLVGVEQCGLTEAIEFCVNSFDSNLERRRILGDIFLTGGVAGFKGFKERMQGELRSRFPTEWGDEIVKGVCVAGNTELDAWRGASLFADAGESAFAAACITKQEYEEKGADYIGEHGMSNWHVPTPYVDPVEAERRKKLQSYKRF